MIGREVSHVHQAARMTRQEGSASGAQDLQPECLLQILRFGPWLCDYLTRLTLMQQMLLSGAFSLWTWPEQDACASTGTHQLEMICSGRCMPGSCTMLRSWWGRTRSSVRPGSGSAHCSLHACSSKGSELSRLMSSLYLRQEGLQSLAHCLCQAWGGGRQSTEGMVCHQDLAQGAPPRFTWHAAVSFTWLMQSCCQGAWHIRCCLLHILATAPAADLLSSLKRLIHCLSHFQAWSV